MTWANDRQARRRSDATYDALYRRNREEAMRRGSWRCQLRIEGVCIGAASECDLIVAVADGGSNDVSNLRAACQPCHRARTAQQGGGFRVNRGGAIPIAHLTQPGEQAPDDEHRLRVL